MNNNSQNDIFSPFRQSATAMSASLLLIIIAITNKLAFWALFVAILSLILSFTILFSCFIKLFTKLNKFTDFVFKLTDQLTYIFILISLVSIIKSLSAIVNLLISSGNKTSPQNLALMRPLSYWTVLIWLCFFGIVCVRRCETTA